MYFITNINNPFRKTIAIRNPKNFNEIENLLTNDFQYLKTVNITIPKISNIPLLRAHKREYPIY